MARALAAFLGFVLGMAFLVVGGGLLAWVAVTELQVARGFDWAMWAAQHLGADPVSFGNRVINMTGSIGFAGAIASLIGIVLLNRALLRKSSGAGADGERSLELVGDYQRVGRPLEGTIVLGSKDAVGERYAVHLECRHLGRDGRSVGTDYSDSAEVQAVGGAGRAWLPFRFEIPLTAPPSQPKRFSLQDRREWHISCARPKAWFDWSIFDLQVEPGPEGEVTEALAAMPPPVVGPFPWKVAGGIVGGLFAGGLLLFFVVDALIGFFRKALS
ncbi:MAG: hypothetical protein ABIQ84_10335 [Usitatibacter sp.]